MRVLGIDPGFERIGIAVVEKDKSQKDVLVFSECFKTSARLPFGERLVLIGKEIERVIKEHKPDELAMESLLFNTNQKTAMRVAEARGVILYEACRLGLGINEYTPPEIKMAVTGYGHATKSQVSVMVQKLISINHKITHDDEMDAISVGLTHIATSKFRQASR